MFSPLVPDEMEDDSDVSDESSKDYEEGVEVGEKKEDSDNEDYIYEGQGDHQEVCVSRYDNEKEVAFIDDESDAETGEVEGEKGGDKEHDAIVGIAISNNQDLDSDGMEDYHNEVEQNINRYDNDKELIFVDDHSGDDDYFGYHYEREEEYTSIYNDDKDLAFVYGDDYGEDEKQQELCWGI